MGVSIFHVHTQHRGITADTHNAYAQAVEGGVEGSDVLIDLVSDLVELGARTVVLTVALNDEKITDASAAVSKDVVASAPVLRAGKKNMRRLKLD